ncbi:MAG: ABC transporter ATP-binding protein [Elusimicrobia bacterium]|nr:ABC transporter ATP-binding protein [Elusimicrobiota bacterium]
MEPILSVRNLRTEFHLEGCVVRAVDGLSYDLYPGKTVAIVGESGSGKSVHALSILRLLPEPPAKIVGGEILFQGRNLLTLPKSEMRSLRGDRIGMIFQEPMTSLNPVLTIGEQIAEAVMLHQKLSSDKALEKAVTLLKKVGIPNADRRVQDFPHQFSGGMRQRAMIAMALSCDPDILIADEPSTALDVTIQAQILELIRDLQKELHMAVILITHNIGVVAGMADDVVVMYAARAVEKAPVEDLFRDPKHPYTKGLLNSVPSIYGRKHRLAAIPGQPPELYKPFVGCPFAPRCAEVSEICKTTDPDEYYFPDGHMANCLLYREKTKECRHRYDERPAAAAGSES